MGEGSSTLTSSRLNGSCPLVAGGARAVITDQAIVLSENCRCGRDFLNQLSENNRCPAVLIDFPQNRVVLLTAESEAHTKLLRQPGFRELLRSSSRFEKRSKVPSFFLTTSRTVFRVFSSPAHGTSSIRAASVFCTCSKMNRSYLQG